MTKRLELNLTDDSFHFQVIPGADPEAGIGRPQADLGLYGLHHNGLVTPIQSGFQACASARSRTTAGQALHIEPGLFGACRRVRSLTSVARRS